MRELATVLRQRIFSLGSGFSAAAECHCRSGRRAANISFFQRFYPQQGPGLLILDAGGGQQSQVHPTAALPGPVHQGPERTKRTVPCCVMRPVPRQWLLTKKIKRAVPSSRWSACTLVSTQSLPPVQMSTKPSAKQRVSDWPRRDPFAENVMYPIGAAVLGRRNCEVLFGTVEEKGFYHTALMPLLGNAERAPVSGSTKFPCPGGATLLNIAPAPRISTWRFSATRRAEGQPMGPRRSPTTTPLGLFRVAIGSLPENLQLVPEDSEERGHMQSTLATVSGTRYMPGALENYNRNVYGRQRVQRAFPPLSCTMPSLVPLSRVL